MATLNTQTSVVDFLKSQGKDSSFKSRTNLAVQQGIVKSAADYIGSASQNTALLRSLQGGSSTPTATPTVGRDTGGATALINANQDDDIANTPSADDAPSRDSKRSSRYSAAFSDISELFGVGGKDDLRPSAPSFKDLYRDLRKDYNVADLEEYVNDLQAEEEDIFATLRQRRTTERGKTVAQNVIEGRINETERQEAERIDYVRRQKDSAVRQLQSANAAIENLINFEKLDYDTARNQYNDRFNQQISIFNVAKGIVDSEISDESREAETARANLNIIYGAIGEGKITSANITPDMQYKINQMEMSAGLPTGFYENLASAEPEAKILSTTTRTSGGAKYADVLYKMPDGSLKAKSVYLGGSSEGSGGGKDFSEADLERENRSIISGALNKVRGSDGYIAPNDYIDARNRAISSGAYSREVFDKEFAREYVNPVQYGETGTQYVFDLLDQFGR